MRHWLGSWYTRQHIVPESNAVCWSRSENRHRADWSGRTHRDSRCTLASSREGHTSGFIRKEYLNTARGGQVKENNVSAYVIVEASVLDEESRYRYGF